MATRYWWAATTAAPESDEPDESRQGRLFQAIYHLFENLAGLVDQTALTHARFTQQDGIILFRDGSYYPPTILPKDLKSKVDSYEKKDIRLKQIAVMR